MGIAAGRVRRPSPCRVRAFLTLGEQGGRGGRWGAGRSSLSPPRGLLSAARLGELARCAGDVHGPGRRRGVGAVGSWDAWRGVGGDVALEQGPVPCPVPRTVVEAARPRRPGPPAAPEALSLAERCGAGDAAPAGTPERTACLVPAPRSPGAVNEITRAERCAGHRGVNKCEFPSSLARRFGDFLGGRWEKKGT